MPKVLVVGEFAVIIFLNDHPPAHVHVRKGRMLAKVGLSPQITLLRYDKDLSKADLRKMLTIVLEHQQFLLEKWNEIHPNDPTEGNDE